MAEEKSKEYRLLNGIDDISFILSDTTRIKGDIVCLDLEGKTGLYSIYDIHSYNSYPNVYFAKSLETKEPERKVRDSIDRTVEDILKPKKTKKANIRGRILDNRSLFFKSENFYNIGDVIRVKHNGELITYEIFSRTNDEVIGDHKYIARPIIKKE